MSSGVQFAALGAVADLNPKLQGSLPADALVSFVPMAAVDADTIEVRPNEDRRYAEVSKGYTPFRSGDVLVAKITPCFENGKICEAVLPRSHGFGSTEFHVVRVHADKVDARYVLHFLRQDSVRRAGESKMTGSAGQRRVPEHFLAQLRVPLPSLAHQRRTADVLDRAEALRAKRRATLVRLDSLIQSIFLDLFGDPLANPRGWPSVRFAEALALPLRNGTSPSHAGKVMAKVLTLSAITGSRFEPDAWKSSTFQVLPAADQTVDAEDFLICRGNGNLKLVGKGFFPSRSMSDVLFPDTMIAARVREQILDRSYLEVVWNSRGVRQQIESLARTTNGTFKVNQTMLDGVKVLMPPLQLQHEFARQVAAIERLKAAQRASLAEMDALFASLQQRAFSGEL